MGYTTEFDGAFSISPPLADIHRIELLKFCDDEHEGGEVPWGYYCQWVPSDDGTELAWDGNEKFLSYVEWLEYLLKTFFIPWGHYVSGGVKWRGEDHEDVGIIKVVDNQVTVSSWKVDAP